MNNQHINVQGSDYRISEKQTENYLLKKTKRNDIEVFELFIEYEYTITRLQGTKEFENSCLRILAVAEISLLAPTADKFMSPDLLDYEICRVREVSGNSARSLPHARAPLCSLSL